MDPRAITERDRDEMTKRDRDEICVDPINDPADLGRPPGSGRAKR
jgi:hypothetical protein